MVSHWRVKIVVSHFRESPVFPPEEIFAVLIFVFSASY